MSEPLPYAPPPVRSSGQAIRFEYVPQSGLLGLTITNGLLVMLTLGFYRFWAKTAVRRHIWSCVHINGEPLEYTGRGGELFQGAIIVFLLFVMPFIFMAVGLQLYFGSEHPVVFVAPLAFSLCALVLWGMALYRARRYQLSRTYWRGIRGSLAGSSWSYTFLNFAAQLLKGLTLGWSTPAMNLNLQERMIGDMKFGSMKFIFRGPAGPLYRTYTLCWFLIVMLMAVAIGFLVYGSMASSSDRIGQVFTENPKLDSKVLIQVIAIILGIFVTYLLLGLVYTVIWAVYSARELSLFASYTSFDRASFRVEATALSLVLLALGNLLILVFSLGFGRPYVQQRNVRYVIDRMHVDGLVDVNGIAQSEEKVPRFGEGLADAFDVGGL